MKNRLSLLGVLIALVSCVFLLGAQSGWIVQIVREKDSGACVSPKAWVDSSHHINYGCGGAVFPVVIYDINTSPITDVTDISRGSFDTMIDLAVGTSADAQALLNALPSGWHLWSTVPGGVGYVGSDPGFPTELVNFTGTNGATATGYYVCDEPQTAADITTCNSLSNTVTGIDSGSLPNSTFNDVTFGGSYPSYGGGSLGNYTPKTLAVDPYGNNAWNTSRPESNGKNDFTSEVSTWVSFARTTLPNDAIGCFTAFYLGSCFPSKREMYDAMWACIVNGADYAGLWTYGRQSASAATCDGSPVETAAQQWTDAVEMINHFAAIKDVFLKSNVSGIVTATSQPTSSVAYVVKQRNDGTYWIFASNYTSGALSDTFTLNASHSSVTSYAANADSSDAAICTNCSSFTDTVPLFGSRVYKITG